MLLLAFLLLPLAGIVVCNGKDDSTQDNGEWTDDALRNYVDAFFLHQTERQEQLEQAFAHYTRTGGLFEEEEKQKQPAVLFFFASLLVSWRF